MKFTSCVIALVVAASVLRSLRADDSPAGEAAGIARWIADLGDPQFARREAAARSLGEAGRDALEPLVAAIRDGELETASRGIAILCGMLDSPEPDLAADAEHALEELAERGEESAAHLAGAVLDFHFLSLADDARMRLEALGAAITPDTAVAGGAGLDLFFGVGWRGTAADLRLMSRVRGIARLRVHGVAVDASTAAVIGRLRSLRGLQLYGTGIGDDGVALIRARIPDLEIDVRKGGKLGVSAAAFAGPCEIRQVQPGSAAELGGVRSGDVVVAIDGEPIGGFEDLTARVALHGPGDALRLSIERPGIDATPTRVECIVRLDSW